MNTTSGHSLPFKPGYEHFPPTHDGYYYPDDPNSPIIKDNASSVVTLESAQQARKLFTELTTDYDIAVAPFSVVMMTNETGYPSIGVIMDRIDGITLDYENDPFEITTTQQAASIALNDKLFDYLESKIISGEPFLGDAFGPHQYLFTANSEPVFVDLAPMVVEPRNPEDTYLRVQAEFMALDFLLGASVTVSEDNIELRQHWGDKATQLIDLICEHNRITFSEDAKHQLIETYMTGEYEAEELESIYSDELHRQR